MAFYRAFTWKTGILRGSFDWLTPFSILCGLGLIAGYALLGASWMIMKVEGAVTERARRQATVALIVTVFFIALVSLWTPLAFERIAARWFAWNHLVYLWPVPAITALIAFSVWTGIRKGSGVQAFLSSMALFLICFLGLGISTFPYLVPPSLTIWDTAAIPQSQIFSLIGAIFLLPLILGYTVFVYWTFRGKVTVESGYH